MNYKLYNSQIIHWDNMMHLEKDRSNSKLQSSISIDLCKVVDEKLPIIIEAKIKIIENDTTLFNCIIHTKAILKFSDKENPINNLVKMLDECKTQEDVEFYKNVLGTELEFKAIPKTDFDPMVKFNKAYQLKEHAIKVGLLKDQ